VTKLAHRYGVSTATSVATGEGLIQGLSAAFQTGILNALEHGAVLEGEAAFTYHYRSFLGVSVSTQPATLRSLLFEDVGGKAWFQVQRVGPRMPLRIM
jgi:hypothetical protein